MLIPAITEVGGIQRYINFGAFLSLYILGIASLVLINLFFNRLKNTEYKFDVLVIYPMSLAMNIMMFAFGLYWYDFSVARNHGLFSEYNYQLVTPVEKNDELAVEEIADSDPLKSSVENIVERFVNEPQYKWQHSMLIARDKRLIVEEYFYDETADKPHDLRSANKSITSILVGIAIKQGLIINIDEPVYKFFPEYGPVFDQEPEKKKITIRQLLTMSSGLDANDWDRTSPGQEDRLYRESDDWVKSFLSLDVKNKPGKEFAYATAGEMTLRALIVNVSKMSLVDFTNKYLFEPLSIQDVNWTHQMKGHPDVYARVELTSRDFLKLGLLYLNKGKWQSVQIVNPDWVSESTQSHIKTTNEQLGFPDYGYLWWKHDFMIADKKIEGYQAQGAGGQFLFVFPSLNVVMVFTSGNYGRQRQINALNIVRDELLKVL